MRALQKQVGNRVDPKGNQIAGPRLAQEQRPQAEGMSGGTTGANKSSGKKWAAVLIGGSVLGGGAVSYFSFL